MKRVVAALLTLALSGCGRSGHASPDFSPIPVPIEGLDKVAAIAAGASHALALAEDGSVWTWGSNLYRQLGADSRDTCGGFGMSQPCARSPLRVSGPAHATALAAGANHSLVLADDGTVWAWGWNNAGQVGDGGPGDSCTHNRCESSPTRVAGLPAMRAVTAGGGDSLALDAAGIVWGWGANLRGQVGPATGESCPAGDDPVPCRRAPAPLADLPPVTAIVAGGAQNLALAADGSVWAWGANDLGQLGDGTFTDRATPVRVDLPGGARAIAAGRSHSLALGPDGAVFTWGRLLGNLPDVPAQPCDFSDVFGPCSTVPVRVLAPGAAVAIAAGEDISLVLAPDGALRAWGGNRRGGIGAGIVADSAPPVPLPDLPPVRAVAAGAQFGLALTIDNAVWAWGDNAVGQLGQ